MPSLASFVASNADMFVVKGLTETLSTSIKPWTSMLMTWTL